MAGRLANYAYGYDNANELTSYTGPEGTLNYTYYPDGERTGATEARAETCTYDFNGNRTMQRAKERRKTAM